MAQLSLKRLLKKNRQTYAVVHGLAKDFGGVMEFAITDTQGNLLMGEESLLDAEEGTTIMANGQVMGRVSGPEDERKAIARLLEHLLILEAEKRDLSEEVLDNYRELNLLYDLSERLISAPEPAAIANMALKATDRLMQISAAWVLIIDSDNHLYPIAKRGRPFVPTSEQFNGRGLVANVLASGEAEILNGETLQSFLSGQQDIVGDLICAPLKTEQKNLGVIFVVGASPIRYQAHHLKLLNTVALQVGPALEIARLYQVAVEKGRLEQELHQAYEVQASLIPRQTPSLDGWAFAGRWQPARELSGDYYDFIPLEDGCLGLVTGDVADKGMPSSLFMVFTRSAVRSSVAYLDSPAAAVAQVNKLVAQESQDGLFVTLIYGRLDPATGQLVYVNAGHNPALWFEHKSQLVRELRNTGMPLGILPDSQYNQHEVYLKPGDFLLFYTDGVTEALNVVDEEFGTGRLLDAIRRYQAHTAEEMASGIESAVLEFIGARPLFDDLTLLVVKRHE